MKPSISLKCEQSHSLRDWYLIVVDGLPKLSWLQKEISSDRDNAISYSRIHDIRRISDACVEGTKAEMLSIAVGIKTKQPVEYRRCAVDFEYDNAYFWSPRNSAFMGEVSYEAALQLANQIEQDLA